MRNKKGFTLVELLVTIALMLSILAIAIVSFIKISNKKKQESYDLVKEQIITAAEQYFNSNEYLFEGLVDGSYGIISVGKLVNEDYLNKVTNPVTGKLVNYCSQVEVKKENGRYVSSFKEYEENDECDSNYSITIKEPGSPSIELSFYKQGNVDKSITVSNSDEWFNISKLGENGKLGVKVTVDTQSNGKITEISKCSMDGKVSCTNYNHVTNDSSFEDNDTFGSETNEKTVCYKVTNISGKSASKCVTAKVDTITPSVTVTPTTSSWTNKDVTYNFEATDTLSSVSSLVSYWNVGGLTDTNANSNTYKWNGSSYPSGGSQTEKSFNGTGKFSAEGSRRIKLKACDVAGNCAYSNESVVKIDKTAPSVTVTPTTSSWTNKDVTYNFEATDTLSSVSSLVSYWNVGGLTDTNANSNTYKWNGSSYPSGGSQTEKSFNGTGTFSAEGSRRIKLKACDVAGNCAYSNESVVRIDKTAPVYDAYGAGRVHCQRTADKKDGNNSWGYSIKYHDELSGATATLTEYYTSRKCDKFYWNESGANQYNGETTAKIYTIFAGCKNNTSPGAKFKLVDGAGNVSNILQVSAITSSINSSYSQVCSQDKWYTENR